MALLVLSLALVCGIWVWQLRDVKTVGVPLPVRAVSTGALLAGCISGGIPGISTLQALPYLEQYKLWGINGGQILFMAMLGFAVGAISRLATGAGSVAALWIEAITSSSVVLPRALTAGLGAAAVTAVSTVLASCVHRAAGLALAGVGAGLSTLAGLQAALHTRRRVDRYHSTGTGPKVSMLPWA